MHLFSIRYKLLQRSLVKHPILTRQNNERFTFDYYSTFWIHGAELRGLIQAFQFPSRPIISLNHSRSLL